MRGSWRHLIWRYTALCAVLLCAVAARAGDFGREVETRYGLYPDFAANLRLQMVGQRVALAAGRTDLTFKIFKDKDLNAFALPDGRVYATSLMATAVSDDELAYVLGHEITHVTEGHAKKQMQRATGGAILGAIIVAVLGGSEHEIRTGADIAGNLTLGHYSRKDELRADEGGVRLMTRAGYDPAQAANAMQRLIDKYGRGDANVPILGWFATHPDSKNRKERLENWAREFQEHPLPQIAPPQGVELTLDPSADHAACWARDYVAYCLVESAQGHVVVIPASPATTVVVKEAVQPDAEKGQPDAETAAAGKQAKGADDSRQDGKNDGKDDKDGKGSKDSKDEPLPVVVVKTPSVPVAYRVTMSLRQIPAGRAADLAQAKGVAVEATLRWTDLASGFTGTCTTVAQTSRDIPWRATDQTPRAAETVQLADGKEANLEGTLEATAVRRAARAFAEVIVAGGPVDHSAPVTIRMNTGGLRPGDCVQVARDGRLAAEVIVEQVGKREVTGTVLWGTHTWRKDDEFVAAQ